MGFLITSFSLIAAVMKMVTEATEIVEIMTEDQNIPGSEKKVAALDLLDSMIDVAHLTIPAAARLDKQTARYIAGGMVDAVVGVKHQVGAFTKTPPVLADTPGELPGDFLYEGEPPHRSEVGSPHIPSSGVRFTG